jgi:hypothetical protein
VADHCVLDYSRQPPRLCCLRCGTEETFTLPMPVRQLVVISDSFIKEHRRCQGGGLMDAIRAELEHIYQLVNQREADLAEREEALAAAMELVSVDPAVQAAFRDGINLERSRWLALIDERIEMLSRASISYTVLKSLRDTGGHCHA